jgi:hypothetical protein
MRKIPIVAMVIILLFSVSSVFAQSGNDIKGWNGAIWGMIKPEIENLFPGQIIKSSKRQNLDDNKYYRDFEIKNYEIDGVKFNVLFEMATIDDKLRRVRLMNLNAIDSYFSQFEQLLTGKYGMPQSKDQSRTYDGYQKTTAWLLPSTKIELIYNYSRGMGTVLNIIYSDQSDINKNLNKL